MVVGCTCTLNGVEHFRIGTGFDFVMQRATSGMTYFMPGYCAELDAYYGSFAYLGSYRSNETAPGGVVNLRSATGPNVGQSTSWNTNNITISPCDFCEFSYTVSGSGSLSDNGTKYNEKYRKGNSAVTITAHPSSGYKLKKLLVNGSAVSLGGYSGGDFQYSIASVGQDYAVVAYFVPAQYTVTCNAPSGGTVAFTKNGNAASVPFAANVDDLISCTATPNADKMVQNFVVDGYVTSGGSTGPQTFSFTIYEREDDATYNCTVAFSDRTAISDSVVGKSDGTTDDATVTTGGASVARDASGAFMAFVGNTYTATAHDPSDLRTFDGWINANGELVGESKAYTWTQGSSSVGITAKYTDKGLYAENFYVGTSTGNNQYGTPPFMGCNATISRSPNVSSGGKWLGGSRTVTVTAMPSGWSFSGVYVSSVAGGSKLYKANGASSVTFDNAADANIYALFSDGAAVSPADVDQGHSSIAAGSAATGLYRWEGGSASMAMRWKSKRFVASAPMTVSTARVYADGYASGCDAIKLKVLTFQSPDAIDSRVQETTAKSQDAYRLPLRRPEKYIELEVSAKAQVTQLAVATSMEALWQA